MFAIKNEKNIYIWLHNHIWKILWPVFWVCFLKTNFLLLIIRELQSGLSTWVGIEFKYIGCSICDCDTKVAVGEGFVRHRSVGDSQRSPRGKSRISLRPDAFLPDSWPALGLWFAADYVELLCVLLSIRDSPYRYAVPPPLLSSPYRYVYAARNYGRCLPHGHRGYLMSLPRSKRYRAEFNSRPLIVATRFVPIRACSNVYMTTQRAQRQLIRRGCN